MMLFNGADSAKPGQPLPAGTKILAAYIGAPDLPGQPDAVHVWSLAEWDLYMNPHSALHVPGLRALPIYVHDYPGDPAVLAKNAVDAAVDLGWAGNLNRLLVVDLETLVDAEYVSALNHEIRIRGFRMMKYGSAGFINQNPPVDGGTWMALLTNKRPTVLPAGTVGQQWKFGSVWDLNVFSQFVYNNCGQNERQVEP